MEKKITYLSIPMVFFVMRFNRIITAKYGDNPSNIIMIVGSIGLVLCVVSLMWTKKYLAAVMMISMTLPIVISTIGACLDNPFITILGVLLLLILVPLTTKFIKRHLN